MTKPTQAQRDLVDGMIDLGNGLFLEEAAYCTYLWKKPSKHSHYFRVTQQDLADHVAEEMQRFEAKLQKATAWQPINTAPKDGTSVLLWDGEIHEGFWDALDYDEFHGVNIYGWNYGNADIDDSNFRPTHWMPLPTPPTEQEG